MRQLQIPSLQLPEHSDQLLYSSAPPRGEQEDCLGCSLGRRLDHATAARKSLALSGSSRKPGPASSNRLVWALAFALALPLAFALALALVHRAGRLPKPFALKGAHPNQGDPPSQRQHHELEALSPQASTEPRVHHTSCKRAVPSWLEALQARPRLPLHPPPQPQAPQRWHCALARPESTALPASGSSASSSSGSACPTTLQREASSQVCSLFSPN